jgi:hypothetical protein
MHCRANAVQALEAHHAVPEWLRAECAHDASSKIRELFAGA